MAKQCFHGNGPEMPEEIRRCLERCAVAARSSLQSAMPCRDEVLAKLREFAAHVAEESSAKIGEFESEQIRLVLRKFEQMLQHIAKTLDQLLHKAHKDLAKSYLLLEESAAHVTIMLFGRTRAGKSTLMEALTHGDGNSMGTGRQHATQEIKEYFWPARPQGRAAPPSLRIVDTPGIEGFRGHDLAAKAERFVEQSDHVFFLLSDDKAGSEELERFGLIRTRGKSVTVILNVKSKEKDYDVLVAFPELVFQKDQIRGHCRRIESYLCERLQLSKPAIIPVHARAAWHATQPPTEHTAGIDLDLLKERSRIAHLEARIVEFIRNDALPARVKAARDLIRGYIEKVQDRLRPSVVQCGQHVSEVATIRRNLEKGLVRSERGARTRLTAALASVDAAKEKVPLMVEELLAAKSGGKALRTRWEALLEEANVNSALSAYAADTAADFLKELREQVSISAFDVKMPFGQGAEGLLDEYAKADKATRGYRFARAGLRAGASAATTGLSLWAIANWWNPTGWVAALALAGTVAVGYVTDRTVKAATDTWKQSTERELSAKQDAIVEELRTKLAQAKDDIKKAGLAWLDQIVCNYRALIDDTLGTVEHCGQRMQETLAGLLSSLDQATARIHREIVLDFLAQVVPAVSDGSVQVLNVAREPGAAAKILVRMRSGSGGKALSTCQGHDGSRLDRLRKLLGDESVVFVDGDAPMIQQVRQAMQPVVIRATDVGVQPGGSYVIRMRGKKASSKASVALDLRLASQLLGRTLTLVH